MRRAPLVLLAPAAALATLAATSALSSYSHPPAQAVTVDVLVGLSFVVVGVGAWLRRPENRTGALMTAVGFAWFLPDVYWLDGETTARISQFFEFFYAVILAHLFMAFPAGRLPGRRERVLTAALYLWWLGASVVELVDPRRTACPQCPLNVVPFVRQDDLWFFNIGPHLRQELRLTDLGLMALFLAVVVVVVSRWKAASPLGRRAVAPVFWASFPALGLVFALEVGAASGLRFGYPLVPYLWWWGPAALVALPSLFLIALLRTRLAHSAVTRLMIKLGDHPPPGRLQQALAETIGDPSLQLAYRLPDKDVFVDADGSPVDLEAGPGRVVQMLEDGGETVAGMIFDASLQECWEPGLVESVAAAARLAVENERLHAQVRAQLEEVRAQRVRLLESGYEARRKIERDLHDGAQQRFLAALLGLRSVQLRAGGDPDLERGLAEVSVELKGAIDELRDLVQGIFPSVLTTAGLRPALLSLAERTPLAVEVEVPDARYPGRVESTAYLIVSEALTNTTKHAQASHAVVTVTGAASHLVVRVKDDGRGGADPSRGTGLQGLVERVEALDGELRVQSGAGGGTLIVAEIPIQFGPEGAGQAG